MENLPAPVSAIILKLLTKTAEERYQTAAGVERDLRRCLAEWETQGGVDEFAIGEHDTPDRLLVPEKLYGRAGEIDTLLASFNRVVATGTPELVLVSGYSGIGKSSVVNELHKVLVPSRGLFASGKFDQYKRNTPYATLAQAFQSLVHQILGKSDAEMERWRTDLLEVLGPNGQLMVNLAPDLALVIGEQPAAPELPPQDQQARFQLVFRRFLGVFARPEHPLALFLDDLQWLDSATLDLIEHLVLHPEVRHLLLIGAYRDNEVSPSHPLARMLARLREAGGRAQEILLAPLMPDDVERLLADALHADHERARPLAGLVFEKTDGNPFFTIQFLLALIEEGLLAFDSGTAAWTWDLQRIRAKGFTDNVADLMAAKLGRLTRMTQEALGQLACLGNAAEIAALTLVHGGFEEAMHAALWEAVRAGLVTRTDSTYTFLHDRIQEAAYALIAEGERAMAHLRIGRLLAARTAPANIEENIFDIVNQFYRGAALITMRQEREQVAELNLIAGRRAKAATAYALARQYFAAGRALLAENGWEQYYQLTFDLELNWAECEYLTGELAAAEERLSLLSTRARTTVDSAAVACVRINLYTNLDQSDSAVEVGLEYLRKVGVQWSLHATAEEVRQEYDRLWGRLGSGSIEALADLPLMTDPDRRATMDVLTVLTSPALFTDLNLFRLVVGRMAILSLEYGNTDGSCLAYAWLGGILGTYFGDYRAGFRFGRLGLDLVETRGLDRLSARVYLVFAVHVAHWTQHLVTCQPFLRRSFKAAQEAGDLTYAAYSCCDLNTNRIASGDPLGEVEREAEATVEIVRKVQFGLVSDIIASQLGLIRALRGLTSNLNSFNNAVFDESRFERRLESNPRLVVAASRHWIRKLQACVYAGDGPSAVAAASKAEALLWTVPTQVELSEYHFYGALARAARWDTASAEERPQHLEVLTAHHKQITVWAQNGPETFANRAALVGAEIARLEGRELDAMRLYEEAIRLAREHGFVQNEGLSNELAARFYAARGFERIAHAYLQDARYCYRRWGADGKVRQLDQSYPNLRGEEPASGPTSTIEAPVEHLDLATVIKVSQAVSGEIVLEKLIDTLMRTAIEHAGAERGLLILPRGVEQRIEAEATTSGDTVIVRLREPSVAATALPESIVHYVMHTQESVILDDAAAQNPYSADAYIRQHQARSILCLPLINQAKLIGVLYLENSLTPHVFTPTRIAVLKLLAAQAAISLENTRLYSDLQEREAKIRRVIDSNIIGIYIWDYQGRILEANDAFLRLVGYSRDDLVSGRLRWGTTLTPDEWIDADERSLVELRATGRCKVFEKEYFRIDGTRVPVLLGAAGFDEPANQGVTFVLDLTERKQAEARQKLLFDERKRAEYLTGQMFESSPDVVCIIGRDYRYQRVNPTYGRNSGMPAERIVGMHIADLFGMEVFEQTIKPKVDRCLAGEDVSYAEWFNYARGRRYVAVTYSPLRPDAEQVEAVLAIGRDLTEHVLASEALRDAQADLAHANRVATLGQLSASIAHEVSQPISAVATNAHAALRWLGAQPPDLEEVRQALGRIVKDGNRAADVFGRIRGLIKKAPPRMDDLEINETILEVIALTRGEAVKNGVSVQTQLAEGLPLIQGDRVQLQQVVLNLIMNAVEAMSGVSEGLRELLISTGKTEPDGVLVAVRDSGPGLAPASLERLFDAFYTTKPGGLGMGLSICRSTIEAHGGRLWAAANVPQGASFQFTLPAHPDSAS